MSDYKLPRTESGEVDWATVKSDLEDNPWGWVTILKAIDANARAEERDTCAEAVEGLSIEFPNKDIETATIMTGIAAYALGCAATVIRDRGDSQ